ncbi:hypothetical protein RSOLAG1IB_11820 [Rhizoctonia solani AG-1 IB]|uniref:Uncharacterized protein n=1 Tax=Thanatephorus cucumeris (strain AG1-IB / isolate 7/3/14) TaxID=1108050 RepID=A0A0B7FFN6_THACB|nr:hypothetical protein RSOLAG1IB_11820 [Rhizoctonia solani AG-1 IB]
MMAKAWVLRPRDLDQVLVQTRPTRTRFYQPKKVPHTPQPTGKSLEEQGVIRVRFTTCLKRTIQHPTIQ